MVPLGGQHISAALLAVYNDLGGKKEDASIPEELKFVDAEVLKHNTNRELCRLAAGEHQANQKDVEGASTADVFSYLSLMAQEKKKGPLETPFMTDNEIWSHCKSMGIQKFVDKYGRDLTEQQQVQPFLVTLLRRNLPCHSFSFFFLSSENTVGAALETNGVLGILQCR